MKARNRLKLLEERVSGDSPQFECPLCGYVGTFIPTNNRYLGRRQYSACPDCGAKERHRLIVLAIDKLLGSEDVAAWSALHFAPEKHLRRRVEAVVGSYRTSEFRGGGDFQLDICNIRLPSDSLDFVVASHVLEHVCDERKAMEEIHRILRPGGYAVLPVPIYAETTIEYGTPLECGGHYRAPGPDYFDRLRDVFSAVDVLTSVDVHPRYQAYLIERRSHWPTRRAPLTKPMQGYVFFEYVPICRK